MSNPALNLAPFSRWTLHDKAAQASQFPTVITLRHSPSRATSASSLLVRGAFYE